MHNMRESKRKIMKPTIPEVLPLINQYAREDGNSNGGSFHIVLEDGNVTDHNVEFCLKESCDRNEILGVLIGEKLLLMSKTQRLKISYMWSANA